MLSEPARDGERHQRDHRDLVVRVGGRLPQCVAQRAKQQRADDRNNPVASSQAWTRGDQIDGDEEQPEEQALVIRKYLDSGQAKQSGQWRAEQEYVCGNTR